MAATDLISWTKLIGFTDHPDLACCEIATYRYRVLHVAARITRGAQQLRLRINATWRWAQAITTAWARIRGVSPDPKPDSTRRKTHRPWKARPPSDTGRSVTPTCHNWHHQPAEPDSHALQRAPHAESRLVARLRYLPQICRHLRRHFRRHESRSASAFISPVR